LVTGRVLVALYGWFRLAQNLMPTVNALLLGSLLYQSFLVPRVLPLVGFIRVPLLIADTIAVMFGISTGPLYLLMGICVLPIALFEFSLGVWLIVKGFNSSAVITLPARTSNPPAEPLIASSDPGSLPGRWLLFNLEALYRDLRAIVVGHIA
jgi:hypothetical protein